MYVFVDIGVSFEQGGRPRNRSGQVEVAGGESIPRKVQAAAAAGPGPGPGQGQKGKG